MFKKYTFVTIYIHVEQCCESVPLKFPKGRNGSVSISYSHSTPLPPRAKQTDGLKGFRNLLLQCTLTVKLQKYTVLVLFILFCLSSLLLSFVSLFLRSDLVLLPFFLVLIFPSLSYSNYSRIIFFSLGSRSFFLLFIFAPLLFSNSFLIFSLFSPFPLPPVSYSLFSPFLLFFLVVLQLFSYNLFCPWFFLPSSKVIFLSYLIFIFLSSYIPSFYSFF